MLADVIVFKRSGKFYTDARHEFEADSYWGVVEEMRGLLANKRIPGMVEGAEGFHVLVTPYGPDGPGVPRLFLAAPLPCEAPADPGIVAEQKRKWAEAFEKGPRPIITRTLEDDAKAAEVMMILTDKELILLEDCADWFNNFMALPDRHPSETGEVAHAVHALQAIIMARLAKRAHPGMFN